MARVMRVVSPISFLLCIASITVSLCNGNLNVPCKENERQALLLFKKDLIDSSNMLSSWTGVACDNLTGHVHELHLAGPIPVSLGNLSCLEELIIHNNSLEGVVSEVHFTNLTRLSNFYADENSLTLKTSPNWVPPFQLSILRLGSWRLEPSELPAWLKSQKHLSALNMSNTGISGTIPTWFWDIFSLRSVSTVDLSCNQLSGEVPNIVSANWPKQKHFNPHFSEIIIDLRSNQFNGSLPLVSSTVTTLDLSNSSFLGTLSLLFGFYLSLGLGFAFDFWIVLGLLLSNVPWSNAFSRFQNHMVMKLYAAIVERY
ncbi:hypothetical protein DVH24_000827 [Malus domestica]|uniref:Leucine-rich repeat-containing N-terminal plant-type domain-containing protein n=1 Tax=Malus domestica TaxID=3750 RepID=A0A498K4L0_MALDO|nr:hypothetical protein DVH24_000827 [Malus domestica]